jgi:hypothetical protein
MCMYSPTLVLPYTYAPPHGAPPTAIVLTSPLQSFLCLLVFRVSAALYSLLCDSLGYPCRPPSVLPTESLQSLPWPCIASSGIPSRPCRLPSVLPTESLQSLRGSSFLWSSLQGSFGHPCGAPSVAFTGLPQSLWSPPPLLPLLSPNVTKAFASLRFCAVIIGKKKVVSPNARDLGRGGAGKNLEAKFFFYV